MNDVNKTWTHALDVPAAGEALPGLAPSFIYRDLDATALARIALDRGEGRLSRDGALSVDTGHHTGRSPKDKFIVRDAQTEDPVWWDHSQAMTAESFATLKADVIAHLSGKDVFEQDLHAGWEPGERIAVSVFTEYAWHSMFIRNLLIVPTEESPDDLPRLTIIAAPEFAADPQRHGCRSETVIACDFTNRLIIIAGTSYAGEMKKAVFTYLNYVLPERGVLPMHCSANHGPKGDTAVFFGLSGTGKTTLSNTPGRTLIGDDEHGWGHHGVFNFEGGCYAKTIGLTFEAEPLIYAAVNRFGAVLENVTLSDVTSAPDFDDVSRTENTRGAYPLSFLSNASDDGRGGHPKNVVMLTADAFGVLPPVARLTPAEAAYHFLSGFTAKVAGTEKGLTGPEPTFSTCFGAPFMPRHPMDYAALLMRLVDEHQSDCWLVNTGWTGGPVGVGRRMPLTWTRAILDSVLDGSLENAPTRTDPRFGFAVPLAVEGFPAEALDPRATWADTDAYDAAADKLVDMFASNFAKFADLVSDEVAAAGPKLLLVR